MPTLSVLYVVRNEQDTLEKSLTSIRPIADEIVIIDTGSFDKTLSICRKFSFNRIFSHVWSHDFSKTKNYGIKQCKGDWILSMDADEMLDPNSASVIKTAVSNAKQNIAGFALHIKDHPQALDPESPINPRSFFPSPQCRVFRRDNKIMFQGKVAEKPDETVKQIGGIDLLDAKIHHFLWRGKGDEYRDGRLRYYAKLGAAMPIPPSEPAPREESAAPLAAIVIPAFNSLAATKECVAALTANTKCAYNLHMVDNGSTDGTFEYMKGATGRTPQRFIQNVGVARAKNAGAREALSQPQTKYVCFLDNDTHVMNGWLDSMISVLEQNQKIGMIGPLSNNAEGPQNLYTHQGTSNQPLEQRNPEFFLDDSIGGFCMVVRADVLRKVGFFDESFGQYGFEDKDFCQRVREAGFDIAIANRVYVDHKGKVCVTENKIDWNRLQQNAYVKYSQKWLATKTAPAAGPHSPNIPRIKPRDPKFSFVILTHNRLDMTKQCIDSILATSSNFELVLVDNGSTDETVEWVRNRVPSATIIKNAENLGVPKARNQGIRATTTDIVVIMDNDVILQNGWFDELHEPIKSGVGDIVGIEAWQIDHNFSACWKCQAPHERVDYLGGACNMFRRKIFETVGLLDEGFSPAYYEDVDICIRAKASGFKLIWKPTNKVIHKEHATLVHCQRTFKYQEALANSHARFAKKMRSEIRVNHEHLPPVTKKLKILYLGMYYDYGVRERGTSFEQDNFYPSLKAWDKTKEFVHFDYVDMGKLYGIPKMSDMLYEKVQQICPDVIFSVWYDEGHDPRRDVISKIRKTTPTKVVSWFCDSHYRYENFDRPWAEHVDFSVTTSTAGMEKYVRDGLSSKVIKSQWAASPTYKNMPEVQKDIDVLFIGQPHGDRRSIIQHLKSAGINVETFGFGWNRRLNFDEMITHINRAKINLNLSNGADVRVRQIKGRNFEIPACGGFLLTGQAENLFEYYEYGKEIAIFDNVPNLVEKIRHYLGNPAEREAIAKAGYDRTMKDHTFAQRYDHIFKTAGLL